MHRGRIGSLYHHPICIYPINIALNDPSLMSPGRRWTCCILLVDLYSRSGTHRVFDGAVHDELRADESGGHDCANSFSE